jgi:ABC-type amino acid transport system permease subunit
MEGHNWFLNQLVEILRITIIVGFFSLLAKAGFNLSQSGISYSGSDGIPGRHSITARSTAQEMI